MAGTHEGGQKTAEKLKEKDPQYYEKTGEKGGSHSHGGTNKNKDEQNK